MKILQQIIKTTWQQIREEANMVIVLVRMLKQWFIEPFRKYHDPIVDGWYMVSISSGLKTCLMWRNGAWHLPNLFLFQWPQINGYRIEVYESVTKDQI